MKHSVRALKVAIAAMFILLTRAAATLALSPDAVVVGEITRSQTFEQRVGDGLFVRLVSQADGWDIWVGDPSHPAENFAAVVTGPYRGVNDLDISAWHFRNVDNSGPNDGSVNAPQRLREFNFVTDRNSYQRASAALECMLWACAEMNGEQAAKIHEAIPRGRGTLTITELDLDNLGSGEKPTIRRMRFKIELSFPVSAAKPAAGSPVEKPTGH